MSSHNHKKDLPQSFKKLVSPNAKIKADRRANYLYRHSHDHVDTNLIVFLHGAGDSHVKYRDLFKTMKLPQCACLSLSASCMNTSTSASTSTGMGTYDDDDTNGNVNDNGFVALPFGLGHTWFQEMDYTTGIPLAKNDPMLLNSLDRAVNNLELILQELINGNGNGNKNGNGLWSSERIFLFGYSAGACVAMQLCWERMQKQMPMQHGTENNISEITSNRSGQRTTSTSTRRPIQRPMQIQRQPLGGAICIAGGMNHNMASTLNYIAKNKKNETDDDEEEKDEHKRNNNGTPVLIIGGSKDETCPPACLRDMAQLYNGYCHADENENDNDNDHGSSSKTPATTTTTTTTTETATLIPANVFIKQDKGHAMIQSKEETRAMMRFCGEHMVRRMVAMEGFSEISPGTF